jgi:hypothetical protein
MGPVFTAVLNASVLALTPLQRWEATHQLNTNFMTERWFILTGVLAIIILTVLLFVVSYNRIVQERKAADQLFIKYAEERGLSEQERQILLDIAGNAGLRQSEAIFTMDTAFDRGAAKMIEEGLAQQGTEESKLLRAELSFLREKLGFQKQHPLSVGSPTKSNKLSSRQIPVGKKLHLTRRKTRDSDNIEATIIKNNDMELMVRLGKLVKSTSGELWCVRYYFGASVWEFDTSVISCHGSVLVLNHSENVRFINRRRFLRVQVNKPAFIACFTFAKTLAGNNSGKSKDASGRWGPPEFVPAVVTELAGPGLRIEAPLEVKAGERVLVVFKLDEAKNQDSEPTRRHGKTLASKIIEDIGEVRHTKVTQNGFSIAVELTGLSDSDVNLLIRATNAASLKAGAEGREPGLINAERSVPEPAVIQGV